MIRRVLVAALALPACSAVYGADEPGPLTVHGTYERRYATNGSDLTPVARTETYPPSEIGMSVILDDGTNAPVSYHDDGTFELVRARDDQPYRLTVSTSSTVEYQLASGEPHLVDYRAGRRDAVAVTAATPIHFANESGVPASRDVASTGLWSDSSVGDVSAPLTFDWRVAASKFRIGLLDARQFDALFLVERTPSRSTPSYDAITSALRASVTLADGQPTTVTADPVDAPPGCATVHAHHVDEATRLATLVPDATGYAQDTLVVAVAALELGAVGAIEVAGQTNAGSGDDAASMAFINPFGGALLATYGTAVTRGALLPGASQDAPLPSGTRYFGPVAAGGACGETDLGGARIGLPGAPTLGGVELSEDRAVMLDVTHDQILTWPIDEPVDMTVVSLERVDDVAGTTTLSIVEQIVVTGTSAVLHAGLLSPGQHYLVRFDTATGFPDAADGDFRRRTFPEGNGTSWSHVFQVGS